MEIILALMIAVLTAAGIFLILQTRTYPVVLGLTLLSYGVNLFLFSMGRLHIDKAAILGDNENAYTDPLPQALVLTAIVIGFAMTAFVIALSLKAYSKLGNDHIDGMHTKKRRER